MKPFAAITSTPGCPAPKLGLVRCVGGVFNFSLAGGLGLAGVVSVPSSGPNRLDRPSRVAVPRFFKIPASRLQSVFRSPETPRLDAILFEAGRRTQRNRDQAAEFGTLSAAIQARATREEWSARRFSKETGISRTTWKRLLAGEADLGKWLPKVRAVAASLDNGRERAA